MSRKDFRGEIWTNVDARVMEALIRVNDERVDGCVGGDSHSRKAIEWMQKYFREKIEVVFTINGTGANMIALKAMLDRVSSVICADETHINVYEAGALEYTLGNKILPAESVDGKLSPESIERMLGQTKKYKYIPKVVVLTQPTELGAVYTLEEMKALCDFAHERGMYVYVDGARIGNALAALGCDLTAMIEGTGVDVFSFGGTKAGAMFGEMVVFRREEFWENLAYLQKQSFQHFDKSKFLGAQMECLLEQGIWMENAQISNEKAQCLARKFLQKGIPIAYPVESNMVFGVVTEEQLARVTQVFDAHYWNEEKRIVRFAVTAGTTEEAMDQLVGLF